MPTTLSVGKLNMPPVTNDFLLLVPKAKTNNYPSKTMVKDEKRGKEQVWIGREISILKRKRFVTLATMGIK